MLRAAGTCSDKIMPAHDRVAIDIHPHFRRLHVSLGLTIPGSPEARLLNPASARLRDGSLRLYPRVVSPGNVSRIGAFAVAKASNGATQFSWMGYALEPQAPYELRNRGDGYGCEDPRITFVPAIDRFIMAYTAFGPRGPEVAIAVSDDARAWQRLGLMRFQGSAAPFADKDAAFFPEPVRSPKGTASLAFYHRPTRWPADVAGSGGTRVPAGDHEDISIGYVSLDAVRSDIEKLCEAVETHELVLPKNMWGHLKVGAGTPPVAVPRGWLSVIHGVDLVERPGEPLFARYCAGLSLHDRNRRDRILYRTPSPLFVPEARAEIRGIVDQVVFPTAIDHDAAASDGSYDIYYGVGDDDIGWGCLTLGARCGDQVGTS